MPPELFTGYTPIVVSELFDKPIANVSLTLRDPESNKTATVNIEKLPPQGAFAPSFGFWMTGTSVLEISAPGFVTRKIELKNHIE